MDKYREVNKKLYLCFVDHERAFDRLTHNNLLGKFLQCHRKDQAFMQTCNEIR